MTTYIQKAIEAKDLDGLDRLLSRGGATAKDCLRVYNQMTAPPDNVRLAFLFWLRDQGVKQDELGSANCYLMACATPAFRSYFPPLAGRRRSSLNSCDDKLSADAFDMTESAWPRPFREPDGYYGNPPDLARMQRDELFDKLTKVLKDKGREAAVTWARGLSPKQMTIVNPTLDLLNERKNDPFWVIHVMHRRGPSGYNV